MADRPQLEKTFGVVVDEAFQQLAALRAAHTRELDLLKAEIAGLKTENAALQSNINGASPGGDELHWSPKHRSDYVQPVLVEHVEVLHEGSEDADLGVKQAAPDSEVTRTNTFVQKRDDRATALKEAVKKLAVDLDFTGQGQRNEAETMLMQVLGRQDTFRYDSMLEQILLHPYMEMLVATMILTSSVTIGVEVQVMSYSVEILPAFVVLDYAFNLFFLVELVLRLCAFQSKFFTRPDRRWNIFDLVLVVLSLVDIIMSVAGQEATNFNAKSLKMLRVLRLIRVFRFFRQLASLAAMVLSSLKHLAWALILFGLIIYIVALTLTSWATDFLKHETNNFELSFSSDANLQRVHIRWGNVWNSCYTLLMVALNGISWGEVTDLSIQVSHVFTFVLFAYITFSVIAVLNVFTGVFVDEALDTKRNQLDVQIEQKIRAKQAFFDQLRALFAVLDVNGDGTISLAEIEQMLEDANLAAYFEILGFERRDAKKLFELLDQDGSGEISVVEFFNGCERITGVAKGIDIHLLLTEAKRSIAKLTTLESRISA